MTKHPKAFGRLYVSMVRAGEIGGALDSVLQRLADTIEKRRTKLAAARDALLPPAAGGASKKPRH